LTMDLVASSRSATVTGLARNHDGKPVANATIVAVPGQRYRKRSDRYVTATSDQTGHFTLRGVRPADYTLFSWETLDGEQYFDPDFLKRSEGRGTPMKLAESERKSLELEVIPTEEQP
jgi:Carboxypeptidase regulatory-like domain